MTAKRALVVDDSKSARVVLSRMLEKYGITVDSADSAEAALDYMQDGRPDVVFMDHLMPGMDGLQAVQILKADPATAAIPIVMYTSQEGELYVGQAKAMGAVGVLPKTVRPIDVTKILFQLRLLPERRDARPSPLQPVDETGAARLASEAADHDVVDPRTRGFIEAMLKEQSLELRRFMVATLETQAQRLIAELRAAAPEPAEAAPPPAAAEPERPWGWIAAFAASLAALLVLGGLYWQSRATARDVEVARARLEQESTALRSTLAEVREAGHRPAATVPAARPAPAPARRTEVVTVPYGEVPLAPSRLDAVRTQIASLEAGGFAGTVNVETFTGTFCLNGDPDEGFSLAPPEQPASECDVRGNPFDESLTGAARQPVAFANLARSLERRTDGRMRLTLVQGSPGQAVAPYPDLRRASAGAWNEAAQANNRLEISVLSR